MYDIIIIGSGPSGVMCASNITNKKVLLIDKNERIGGKIKVSGGGRCNVTTTKSLDELLDTVVVNKKFLYPTLNNFNQEDIFNFFNNNGCPLKVEDHNRVFPKSNRSQSIIEHFENILSNKNIDIKLNYGVTDIKKIDDYFLIDNYFKTKVLVLATGGMTYQHLGTTGDGYKFAEEFSHTIKELYPCESPLVSNDEIIMSKIFQGITLKEVNCDVLINGKRKLKVVQNVLFTHFGISGPAALHASSFIRKNIDNGKKVTFRIHLDGIEIPKKMKFIEENYIDINIETTKGFKTAFLTGGGVSVKEIDPKTFQSKKCENLYIIGELMDINCYTGGNNITVFMSQGMTLANHLNEKKIS